MTKSSELVHQCLYFTAGSLSRAVGRLADAAFAPTGLSPSHAFVLMLAAEEPGIGPGELAERLSLAPSTVTRFVDQLVAKGLLTRTAEGRTARLAATSRGLGLLKGVEQAWKRLHIAYASVLGPEADRLAREIDAACQTLGK
ncbi:MAG: MarR family transcriptional regulator [Humidesulfovibrio sp.]|jgi:DNA-binding MarR family transcriptional regulator|uniref:MarR family winged helix-turn-helix transcriptional regulator n=1 Tax=Humidesulfovibrio sp. TaxID=2910988 RepID=UPI002736A877|nr:MarR family transcriptional regulator [Humidesulfovibrio sp.]MDP2848662.1 MarR family transcriptional regulator [Humidesulfovibrio sp.]